MRIFLIGMPGSGKTRIGRALAKRLQMPFFDLDYEIEKETNKNIPEIFLIEGEEYFRRIEEDVLRMVIDREKQFVLATGGGAPCFFDNMAYMNQNGITIFLNVPIEDLYKRLVKRGANARPLLKDKTPDELQIELQKKFNDRLPYYRRANQEITTSYGVVEKRVAEIVDLLSGSKENSET